MISVINNMFNLIWISIIRIILPTC